MESSPRRHACLFGLGDMPKHDSQILAGSHRQSVGAVLSYGFNGNRSGANGRPSNR